jgi:alpha-maltose-1-phosphate synthase
MATAAIWYESDGYRLEGRPLMGRRVAGQEFLKAFARFARTDRFTAVVRDQQNQGEFLATMRELRPEIPATAVTPDAMGELADVGCLFPAPSPTTSPGCGAILRRTPGACAG